MSNVEKFGSKTTVARAIAQDMGWTVVELNASDTRNAVAIRKATNTVIDPSLAFMIYQTSTAHIDSIGRSRPYWWGITCC